MATCLRICEALLAGGPACHAAANKLAAVCHRAFAERGESRRVLLDGEEAWVGGQGWVTGLRWAACRLGTSRV